MLSGIYENSIDSKARIVVPQDLRTQIANQNGEVWLTYSPNACVRIYSCEVHEELVKDIWEAQKRGEDTRALQALFIRPARKVTIDQNGRVTLSADMRRRAKLLGEKEDKLETAVVGNIDHLEIWSMTELMKDTETVTEEIGFEQLRLIGHI